MSALGAVALGFCLLAVAFLAVAVWYAAGDDPGWRRGDDDDKPDPLD